MVLLLKNTINAKNHHWRNFYADSFPFALASLLSCFWPFSPQNACLFSGPPLSNLLIFVSLSIFDYRVSPLLKWHIPSFLPLFELMVVMRKHFSQEENLSFNIKLGIINKHYQPADLLKVFASSRRISHSWLASSSELSFAPPQAPLLDK